MWGTILAVLGSFMGVFVLIKYVILMELRLDAKTFKALFEIIKEGKSFAISEEFVTDAKYPIIFQAFCSIKDAPFFFLNHSERLLTAGFQGKESVSTVTCFRWKYSRLRSYLEKQLKELELVMGVPVELITPNYIDRIGMLKTPGREPLLKKEVWQDIADEVDEVFTGKRDKTGAILYGPPGNGKTSFVKYLATKHRVPIRLITFNPDFTNHDLMGIFSQIGPRCIVLLEDFDNYFDGRSCIVGTFNSHIKFTFDIILNGLDGVYTTYENVVFIMTVNHLEKVDSALKSRPSRFKYVRKFDNPDDEVRASLLPPEAVAISQDLNLDQLLRLKEYLEAGLSLTTAMNNISKGDWEERERMAYLNYHSNARSNP